MTDLTDNLLWTPYLATRLKAKLVYYAADKQVLCTHKTLPLSLTPRAWTEDYAVVDIVNSVTMLPQRILVQRNAIVWPKVDREPKVRTKKPLQRGKELARLARALAQLNPEQTARLLQSLQPQPSDEVAIPY